MQASFLGCYPRLPAFVVSGLKRLLVSQAVWPDVTMGSNYVCDGSSTPPPLDVYHSLDETGRYANMAANKTLYLANPYGFSAQQREGPLAELVAVLKSLGAEVWEPFARNSQINPASSGGAYQIGQADLRDVHNADGLFAVVNGCPPDEGVMVELGLAIAWEKPVFLFRDDFRRCSESEAYPLNLMVFTGLPEEGWQAYWYTSIEEIADPAKALVRWLNEGAPSRSKR